MSTTQAIKYCIRHGTLQADIVYKSRQVAAFVKTLEGLSQQQIIEKLRAILVSERTASYTYFYTMGFNDGELIMYSQPLQSEVEELLAYDDGYADGVAENIYGESLL